MNNPTYLLILVGLSVVCFYLQSNYKLSLFKNPFQAILYFSIIFFSGLTWDYFSVKQNIWIFPSGGTIGLNIGALPVEEYLFFLVAPYFGLTIYKFLEYKF